MIIVCVDNTPIMLRSLKEDADKAYPNANVQTFLAAEPALAYAEKLGCDVLIYEINPPRLKGLFLAEKVKISIPGRISFLSLSVRRANTQRQSCG